VLTFVLAQAGFAAAVRTEAVRLRDPVFFEKLALLERHPEFFAPPGPDTPFRVLAVGSSRTLLGFDARRFADQSARPTAAFNFGTPAAGSMTVALYVRRLLDRGARPDRLLVEVHPCFLGEHGPEPFEAGWLHPYRLRADEPDRLRGYGYAVPTPPHLGPGGWLLAASAYRFPLLDAAAPRLLPCPFGLRSGDRLDPFGWGPGVEPAADLRPVALASARMQYEPVLRRYRLGGPGPAAVRDALAACREYGVPAAVLVPPEAAAFRGWYGADGRRQIAAFLDDLRAEVPVIDAREWVADDGFADGHHLTRAGAAAFTDRLAAHEVFR
jgi:hypothetical protein